MAPHPEIIRKSVSKIIKAFEDVIQTEILKKLSKTRYSFSFILSRYRKSR